VKVIAIAAVSRNGVIGRGSELPWHIPEDLKFFKDSTRGQRVIMGRKTYDSLGKALPGRENGVITRNLSWSVSDAQVFSDLGTALEEWKPLAEREGKNIFVIGGAEIYRLSFPFLDEIWLTEIDAEFEGDVVFPEYQKGELNLPEFRRTHELPQKDFAGSNYRYRFSRFERLNGK
jgi:dihydrofolate reductase